MEQELVAAKMWLGLVLSIMVYGFFMLNASACRNVTNTKEIRAFDVIGVLAENLGLLLRLVQGKRGYSSYMSPEEVFGINGGHVCSEEAVVMANALMNHLRRKFLTYPTSQRACAGKIANRFVKDVKDREAWRASEERMRQAYDKCYNTFKRNADWFKETANKFEKSQSSFDDFQKQFKQTGQQSRHQEQSKQSTSKSASSAPGWRGVLGLKGTERDVNVVKRAYRKLALQFHPDRGGSHDVMARLNTAFAQARQELSFV